jgi:hypothetical protein
MFLGSVAYWEPGTGVLRATDEPDPIREDLWKQWDL